MHNTCPSVGNKPLITPLGDVRLEIFPGGDTALAMIPDPPPCGTKALHKRLGVGRDWQLVDDPARSPRWETGTLYTRSRSLALSLPFYFRLSFFPTHALSLSPPFHFRLSFFPTPFSPFPSPPPPCPPFSAALPFPVPTAAPSAPQPSSTC